MTRWTENTLAEICNKLTDGTHDSPKLQETGIPFIKGVHVKQGRIDFENCDFITFEEHQKVIKRSKAERNDILLANIGINIGELGFVNTDEEFSIKNVALLKVNQDKINSRYLYYILKNPTQQERLRNHKGGSAQPFLSLETLRGYKIKYHKSPPTQRKIASILSAYDDMIENNLKRIKLLEEAAQLQFKIILRDEKCKEFPIDELADVVMGQSPTSNTYNIEKDGLPFHQGVTNFSNYFIEHKTYCNVPIKIAEPNDILFSVRAPVGRINFTQDKICIGRGLCAFRSKKEFQNSLYQQLKTFFFQDDVVGNGAIFNAVTKTELMAVKLKTPSDEVLQSFEEYAQPIYKMILTLSKQNTKLREARDILLPRLMSGEIEV